MRGGGRGGGVYRPSQKTRGVKQIKVVLCGTSVVDGGSTLTQYKVNVLCLLDSVQNLGWDKY